MRLILVIYLLSFVNIACATALIRNKRDGDILGAIGSMLGGLINGIVKHTTANEENQDRQGALDLNGKLNFCNMDPKQCDYLNCLAENFQHSPHASTMKEGARVLFNRDMRQALEHDPMVSKMACDKVGLNDFGCKGFRSFLGLIDLIDPDKGDPMKPTQEPPVGSGPDIGGLLGGGGGIPIVGSLLGGGAPAPETTSSAAAVITDIDTTAVPSLPTTVTVPDELTSSGSNSTVTGPAAATAPSLPTVTIPVAVTVPASSLSSSRPRPAVTVPVASTATGPAVAVAGGISITSMGVPVARPVTSPAVTLPVTGPVTVHVTSPAVTVPVASPAVAVASSIFITTVAVPAAGAAASAGPAVSIPAVSLVPKGLPASSNSSQHPPVPAPVHQAHVGVTGNVQAPVGPTANGHRRLLRDAPATTGRPKRPSGSGAGKPKAPDYTDFYENGAGGSESGSGAHEGPSWTPRDCHKEFIGVPVEGSAGLIPI